MKLAVKQPSESMPNLLTEGEEEEEEDMAVDVDHVPQTEEQMEQGEDDDDEGEEFSVCSSGTVVLVDAIVGVSMNSLKSCS